MSKVIIVGFALHVPPDATYEVRQAVRRISEAAREFAASARHPPSLDASHLADVAEAVEQLASIHRRARASDGGVS